MEKALGHSKNLTPGSRGRWGKSVEKGRGNTGTWLDYNGFEVLCNNLVVALFFLNLVLWLNHMGLQIYKSYIHKGHMIFMGILLIYFGSRLILGCNIHTHNTHVHVHLSVPLKAMRIFGKSPYLSPLSMKHLCHIALVTDCGEHLSGRCFMICLQWHRLFCKRCPVQIRKLALSINVIKFHNNHENKIFSRS